MSVYIIIFSPESEHFTHRFSGLFDISRLTHGYMRVLLALSIIAHTGLIRRSFTGTRELQGFITTYSYIPDPGMAQEMGSEWSLSYIPQASVRLAQA
jgi:hypothetical protein